MDPRLIITLFVLLYFIICWILNISFKIGVFIALFLIIIAAIFLARDDKDTSNLIAIIAFELLVVAVLFMIVENLKELRNSIKSCNDSNKKAESPSPTDSE
jgi:hypothetical protein